MRRRLRVAMVLGGFTLLIAGSAAGQSAALRERDPIAVEQRKLQQTQKQLREEREKAAEAKKKEVSLLADLEQIDQNLARKKRQVARLGDRIQKAQVEVDALRADIRRLETRRRLQQQALSKRLRTMYKIHAQGGALPAILTGDDPSERALTVRHLTTLAAVDARLIQEYRVTTAKLGERTAREESRRTELAALRTETEHERAEMDRDAARRRTLLAKVKDERLYHERMVGELTEASRRLEALIRGLQEKRVARVPPPSPSAPTPAIGFGAWRGRLPWPTDGRLVAGFGVQVHPRFGTRTFKNGVDIEADDGTSVKAVYAGHVVYAGWFKGYGNLVILDHGNEYFTLYAHIAEIAVKEGDDVRQGQGLGTVGDTGSLAGPRLYFEVRYQGKPQDPGHWLRQRG